MRWQLYIRPYGFVGTFFVTNLRSSRNPSFLNFLIETNISLLDFNKLENNGHLKPIFIELLKAEKIKNIIPNDSQIKVSAEELLLKNNIDQLNKEKNKQYC